MHIVDRTGGKGGGNGGKERRLADSKPYLFAFHISHGLT